MGFRLNPYVTPLGAVPIHEPDSVTAELKLLIDVIVIVEVFDDEPEVGRLNVSVLGTAEMPKSAPAAKCAFSKPLFETVM